MADNERRQAILAEIEALGPVLPGSIVERQTRCQRAGCHCHDEPPRLHGPYPTWLHKQVTRTLSAEEADRLRPMIVAHRRLKALVAELEELAVAEVVPRRR